ncbi:isoflavone reductase [Microdochium trichocladiopsis]|uniref:Isoflavone reductase n=1 Tax=Microdochium trichocladiopsis TaxID=1682393 RepID=A0A9P8Y1W5_9PEZI|nr:isoflavone reductase [Microdochium trichocladiopsis]KAH7025657.1 isoflavone reductase [Microdochium trichocladiopsis]
MASCTLLRVVVAGASGETGQSIMAALLAEPAQFKVVALARHESAGKEVYQEMARAGATVEAVDFCDVETLAARLVAADVVISCLLPLQRVESETLIDAAHRASVGRFVPSFFSTIMPPRGIMEVRDVREDLLDRCKLIYLPYTVIDAGSWYQISLPPPYAPPPPLATTVIGDGDIPTAMIDKADIGPYVARIIADPQTLNRFVFVYGEVTTLNGIWTEVETATGEAVPRDSISVVDLEARIAALRSSVTADPTNVGLVLDLAMGQYLHSRHVRGDNTPDRAKYLGYLDCKILYPDVKCKSLHAYIREVVDGKRDYSVYVGRDVVADATQHRD